MQWILVALALITAQANEDMPFDPRAAGPDEWPTMVAGLNEATLESLSLFMVTEEGESELVLKLDSDEDFTELLLYRPNGDLMMDARWAAAQSAMHEISIETQFDAEQMSAGFPEGAYVVLIRQQSQWRMASMDFRHPLPEQATPRLDVLDGDLRVQWRAARSAVRYRLEFENEDQGFLLVVWVDSPALGYQLPLNVLPPGDEIEVTLSSVSGSGNQRESEVSFPVPKRKR